MKALIFSVLLLGLVTVTSCKKEVQTASPSASDTISNTEDTMNVNSNSADTITQPLQTAPDSTDLNTNDSVSGNPRR